jgi:hypothetical protein
MAAGDYHPRFNGTSSATPHVSGLAALILSISPCLTNIQVTDIIEQTAVKIGSYNYSQYPNRPNGTWWFETGYGLIDVEAAVLLAQTVSNNGPDLQISDNDLDDGSEPNASTNVMWHSPDICIRNTNDGLDIHQNPEYSALGNANFINVRMKNNGCVASDGTDELKMYWAKASTSLGYPNPWLGGGKRSSNWIEYG